MATYNIDDYSQEFIISLKKSENRLLAIVNRENLGYLSLVWFDDSLNLIKSKDLIEVNLESKSFYHNDTLFIISPNLNNNEELDYYKLNLNGEIFYRKKLSISNIKFFDLAELKVHRNLLYFAGTCSINDTLSTYVVSFTKDGQLLRINTIREKDAILVEGGQFDISDSNTIYQTYSTVTQSTSSNTIKTYCIASFKNGIKVFQNCSEVRYRNNRVVFCNSKNQAIYNSWENGGEIINCIDSTGKTIWSYKPDNEAETRITQKIKELIRGDILCTGMYSRNVNDTGFNAGPFLQSLSHDGSLQWKKTYSEFYSDEHILNNKVIFNSDSLETKIGATSDLIEQPDGKLIISGGLFEKKQDSLGNAYYDFNMLLLSTDEYGCIDDNCNDHYIKGANPKGDNWYVQEQIPGFHKSWNYVKFDALGRTSNYSILMGTDTAHFSRPGVHISQPYSFVEILNEDGGLYKDSRIIRSDQEGRTWFTNPWMVGQEFLYERKLYDFNLKVGDLFYIPDTISSWVLGGSNYPDTLGVATVTSVDTVITVDGRSRKRIRLVWPEYENYPIEWIEGIGSINSLFWVDDYFSGGKTNLTCYFDKGEKSWERNLDCQNFTQNKLAIVTHKNTWITKNQIPLSIPVKREYSFSMDSLLINAHYYKELEYMQSSGTNVPTSMFFREEGHKVYYLNNGNDEILYDFSLVQGDTLKISPNGTPLIIKEHGIKVTLDGVQRIRQLIQCDSEVHEVVQGVGNLKFLFYLMNICSLQSPDSEIVCFYNADTLVYRNEQYEGCVLSSDGSLPTPSISVNPNPFNNTLNINLKDKLNYSIFSIDGLIQLDGQTSSGVINVGGLINGTYILILQIVNSGRRYSTKIIKM